VTIRIWPEPWSPSVAHLIRARAVAGVGGQVGGEDGQVLARAAQGDGDAMTTSIQQALEARADPLFAAFAEWGDDSGIDVDGHYNDWYPHWVGVLLRRSRSI
jgi:hypothetical protein